MLQGTRQSSIGGVPFGETTGGEHLELFQLQNRQGMTAKVSTCGGAVTALTVPDRQGTFADVILGCNNLAQYKARNPYFGAIIGRFANRISDARFSLDGVKYRLSATDGTNSLHGGYVGFDKVFRVPVFAGITSVGPMLY